jgi:copper homeostasis protein (lipoprotein)
MKRLLILLSVLLLCACDSSPQPGGGVASFTLDAGKVAGSYAGLLPCADCAGVSTRLTLMPNSQYLLQETFLGRSALVFNDHGRWMLSLAGRRIDLISNRRSYPQFFSGVSDNELRALDRQGNAISDTRVNRSLRRVK